MLHFIHFCIIVIAYCLFSKFRTTIIAVIDWYDVIVLYYSRLFCVMFKHFQLYHLTVKQAYYAVQIPEKKLKW